jgi:hypothetical protein
MLAIIVILAFAVILFLNFTIEFISSRKSVQKKKNVESDFLEKAFYEKYKKNPVNFSLGSSLLYTEKPKENPVQITGGEKLFITNCYISFFNALENENQEILNINPLLNFYGNHQIKEKKVKGRGRGKKDIESPETILGNNCSPIDINIIKEEIYNYHGPRNKDKVGFLRLERIISVSFLYTMEKDILMEVVQECLQEEKKIILITKLILDAKNYCLKKINNLELWNENLLSVNNDKGEKDKNFYGLHYNLTNLIIFSTFLAIMSSLECENQQSLLMIKNISSALYSPIINYYKKNNRLKAISLLKIDALYDNVQRVCILSTHSNGQGDIVETEDYLDFECPTYSVPELIRIYNKKD